MSIQDTIEDLVNGYEINPEKEDDFLGAEWFATILIVHLRTVHDIDESEARAALDTYRANKAQNA